LRLIFHPSAEKHVAAMAPLKSSFGANGNALLPLTITKTAQRSNAAVAATIVGQTY
jgi:hypothetical protein